MALKRSAPPSGTAPAQGRGTLSTLSGAFKDQPYSANTRFQSEDGKAGTNPEELIAAAHAGCFTMALAFQLTNAGFEPTELHDVATVSMEKQEIGWTITNIHLDVTGKVPSVTRRSSRARRDREEGLPDLARARSDEHHDDRQARVTYRRAARPLSSAAGIA